MGKVPKLKSDLAHQGGKKKADRPSFPMICPLWLPPKSNC